MEIWLFNLQHTSVLKAQPRQRISNIYICLYVSDQSGYTRSEHMANEFSVQGILHGHMSFAAFSNIHIFHEAMT